MAQLDDFAAGFGGRLASVVESAGGQAKAATLAGVESEQVARWRDGKAKPNAFGLGALAAATGHSLHWLVTGHGPRLASLLPAGFGEGSSEYDYGSVPTDFRLIPRLDVQPSSGFGALAADEGPLEMLAFRADWLRRVGINPEHARVLTNRGDSNEPTIRDGDVLLVDTSINNIVDNAFYIVVFNGLALLKRVQLRRDGSVVLSSDNKLAYQDEIVPVAEVPDLRIAARLMWFGRSI